MRQSRSRHLSLLQKKAAEQKGGVGNLINFNLESGICPISSIPERQHIVLDEELFHRTISLERKRTERSRKPFLLMLLDMERCLPSEKDESLQQILSALPEVMRETDVAGWYTNYTVIGVMFTEVGTDDSSSFLAAMMARLTETLQRHLSLDQFNRIGVSFHPFPEEWDREAFQEGNPALYPDLVNRAEAQKFAIVIKRIVDIVGSSIALVLCMPLFLLIALLIKLTSKGPVLFEQERLGQFGKTFSFMKFRSMYANNDHKIHQEFMKRVISGDYDGKVEGRGKSVYKMTNDPRVTRLGRILRKTSLDELPQFINVLKGEMSLVGPRPPLGYEYREYDIWHRRRVLEMKPGITGLWQVKGRSHVGFDDMVRLDLQYVRTWSLWLDIRILMKTPKAVLLGGDAF